MTFSVLTIAGTDCQLVDLGGVASETGGQVSIDLFASNVQQYLSLDFYWMLCVKKFFRNQFTTFLNICCRLISLIH